ncbi:MAG: aminotransferase class V-fold PLP-dependent enzyme [Acidimicrobiia bacterium]
MRPEAVEAMAPFLAGTFGNPSGGHAIARAAKTALEEAREEIAALLGAGPSRTRVHRGGTEADNLAVKGAARAARRRDR